MENIYRRILLKILNTNNYYGKNDDYLLEEKRFEGHKKNYEKILFLSKKYVITIIDGTFSLRINRYITSLNLLKEIGLNTLFIDMGYIEGYFFTISNNYNEYNNICLDITKMPFQKILLNNINLNRQIKNIMNNSNIYYSESNKKYKNFYEYYINILKFYYTKLKNNICENLLYSFALKIKKNENKLKDMTELNMIFHDYNIGNLLGINGDIYYVDIDDMFYHLYYWDIIILVESFGNENIIINKYKKYLIFDNDIYDLVKLEYELSQCKVANVINK